MPTIAEAIQANNARKAAQQSSPMNPVQPKPPVIAPTPPDDQAAGQGLPQRGMFPANIVMVSDRSDSSRVFRGLGMRSATFPYPPAPTALTTTAVKQAPVQPNATSSSASSSTPSISFSQILGTLLPSQLPPSGVGPGTYTNADITVNSAGIITAASNGSGGSGVMLLQETVNFTNPDGPQDTTAQLVVTGQAWVTANSIIVATVAGGTADHPDPDEPAVEGIVVTVGDLVPGVGFKISAYAPNGTRGRYFVNIVGM